MGCSPTPSFQLVPPVLRTVCFGRYQLLSVRVQIPGERGRGGGGRGEGEMS